MKIIPDFIDPIITSSVYCEGYLDHVAFMALKPFRDSARSSCGGSFFLWTVRYGKGGEHLKIRIHAPRSQEDLLRSLLEDHVTRSFALLPPPSSTKSGDNWPAAQAIDPEDLVQDAYPDRTLRWTSYQRSHVSLGPHPLPEDDLYVHLCTRCFAAATDLFLNLPFGASGLSHTQRHLALFKVLAVGLDALDLPAERVASYLLYHRNWVLRFCLLKNWWNRDQANRFIDLFNRRIREKEMLEPAMSGLEDVQRFVIEEEGYQVWQSRLRSLVSYVSKLEDLLDPFATWPEYPPLLKVFNGTSNQFGLRLMDEAFLYHLLLIALCERSSLCVATSYSNGELAPEEVSSR